MFYKLIIFKVIYENRKTYLFRKLWNQNTFLVDNNTSDFTNDYEFIQKDGTILYYIIQYV